MASGTGAYGGTAQCYRFWKGFTECRENGTPAMCIMERSDYLECLHRDKLKRRIAAKVMEAKHQADAAADAAAGVAPKGHGGGH